MYIFLSWLLINITALTVMLFKLVIYISVCIIPPSESKSESTPAKPLRSTSAGALTLSEYTYIPTYKYSSGLNYCSTQYGTITINSVTFAIPVPVPKPQ